MTVPRDLVAQSQCRLLEEEAGRRFDFPFKIWVCIVNSSQLVLLGMEQKGAVTLRLPISWKTSQIAAVITSCNTGRGLW